MIVAEETQLDHFITRRMLRYCKEVGFNYYESAHAMHLSPGEREQYETEWLEN
ncbi:MAG: hypothetical protein HWE14_08860 [Flavobacteriia bacterium]|nr:hypothetical protein [Flavobacteriia bacterium]